MIFVTLGTQDKGFPRLLEAIENQIKKGNIKEKVIVQAGLTEYESDYMEIFDLVSQKDFDKYVEEASLIITHGGAGSILTAVKKGKRVIAAARLAKYKEHNNDHQLQIVEEFSDKGYILKLDNFDDLDKVLKKSKTFKPKKYVSNTKNIENLVIKYIEEYDNVSWFNKIRFFIIPFCFVTLNTVLFLLLNIKFNVFLSNIIAYLLCISFAFFSKEFNYLVSFVDNMIGFFRFFIFRFYYFIIDMVLVYLLYYYSNINTFFIKWISNIIILTFVVLFNVILKNKRV